jgi:hypothetical protein
MAQGPTQWDLREGVKWQSQLLTTVTEIAKCAGHEWKKGTGTAGLPGKVIQEKRYGNFMNLLRMRGNGNNGYLISFRTVIPKDSIRTRRFLLNIGFKYLLPAGTFQRSKFMCLQRRMS